MLDQLLEIVKPALSSKGGACGILGTLCGLLGYSIIAIPMGIVSIEMSRSIFRKDDKSKYCKYCNEPSHAIDALFCRICGNRLD